MSIEEVNAKIKQCDDLAIQALKDRTLSSTLKNITIEQYMENKNKYLNIKKSLNEK